MEREHHNEEQVSWPYSDTVICDVGLYTWGHSFTHRPPGDAKALRASVPPRLSHDNDENLVDPPAPMRTASIGQRVDTANWAVQVLQSPLILSEAKANTLDAKGVPIGVQFRVANVGRQGASIGSSQFELEDVVGIRYSNIDWYEEGFLSFEQINPGLEYEGLLIFDVPGNAVFQYGNWHLVIDGGLFSDPARVSLGRAGSWTDRRE